MPSALSALNTLAVKELCTRFTATQQTRSIKPMLLVQRRGRGANIKTTLARWFVLAGNVINLNSNNTSLLTCSQLKCLFCKKIWMARQIKGRDSNSNVARIYKYMYPWLQTHYFFLLRNAKYKYKSKNPPHFCSSCSSVILCFCLLFVFFHHYY